MLLEGHIRPLSERRRRWLDLEVGRRLGFRRFQHDRAAEDSIDDKSESTLTANVGSICVDGEGAVPPTSLDTFLDFVNDVNHKADLTDEGVASSFVACKVVVALPGIPEFVVEEPETNVSGVLVLVVAVAGEVRRLWVITLVVEAVDADLVCSDPRILPLGEMQTWLKLARTGS